MCLIHDSENIVRALDSIGNEASVLDDEDVVLRHDGLA